MTVCLNGQTMDIVLENEQTVGEVLGALDLWLGERHESIGAVVLDGREIPIDELEAACGQDINEATKLELRSARWTSLFKSALIAADRFLAEAAAETNPASIGPRYRNWLDQPAAGFLHFRDPALGQLIDEALQTAAPPEIIRAITAERREELEDPRRASLSLPARLSAMAERLEGLPLELQTGKDATAAATLRDFSDLAAKLLRVLPLLREANADFNVRETDGRNLDETLNDLNETLKELVSAYENGDAVLVGDLAEYELAPRLRSMATIVAEP